MRGLRWQPGHVLVILLTTGLTAAAAAVTAPAAAASPLGAASAASTSQAGASQPRPTDPIAHDPTMVKEGRYYYVIITGDAGRPNTYLPIKRSRDLVH